MPLGCYHTHRVDLRYPPVRHKELPSGFRSDEAAEVPGTPIRVEPFDDRRDDPPALGGEYYPATSGCGGSTYAYRRFRTDDDVPRWVRNALTQELQRADYAVSGEA